MTSEAKLDYGTKSFQHENQHLLTAPSIELSLPDDAEGSRRSRSRTFSNVALPFLSSSVSDENEKLPQPFSDSAPGKSHKPAKAEHESRKLLAHILGQLDRRRHAPSLWESFTKENTGDKSEKKFELFRTGKSKDQATKKDNQSRTESFEDSDSDNDRELSGSAFSTDDTFDLMSQLKEVLWISKLQGWSIFVDSSSIQGPDMEDSYDKTASFRRKRSSFQTIGRRSRSYSPGGRRIKSSPELLRQCIKILASIVLEDCRFQTSTPRLKRPPNALHAVTLDVALLILHGQRHNSKVIYEVGNAFIPAFSTFPSSMHLRLLQFFERGILRMVLTDLQKAQMGPASSSVQDANEQADTSIEPIVAIQVDEAVEETNSHSFTNSRWNHWPTDGESSIQNIVSANAPAQTLRIYHLSSIVSPLLSTILDHVDFTSADLYLSHALHSILKLIVETKVDSVLDLLEVAAYHSARARFAAINILTAFWPKSVGHLAVSKPFPWLSYVESLRRRDLRRSLHHQSHEHQFVPWHFAPTASSSLFEGSALHDCQSCLRQIDGFGLFCPFCMCAVHSSCYDAPEGTCISHYPLPGDSSTQKVAVHRFSYVKTPKADAAADTDSILVEQHNFRLVNIFTLSLCGICRLPLWGCVAQGFRCGNCNQYAHASCLSEGVIERLARCSSEPDLASITVDWAVLRSSFADFYHDILFREQDVLQHSHEEICVYWTILWTQQNLLKLGVASGSILVSQVRPKTAGAKSGGVDDFELQYLVQLYEVYLASGRLPKSPVLQDCLQRNNYPEEFHQWCFDWSILTFITSVIKTPLIEDTIQGDFLNVDVDINEGPDELLQHPLEVASVSHLRNALGQEFQLHDDQSACFMLSHIRHLGLFHSNNLPEGMFRTVEKPATAECKFALPLGLDLSETVETLIVAVEACLRDVSLNVNEAGFLMLSRMLWPNGMASDYALARLTAAVVGWILAEDENLAVILREYVAGGKSIPAGIPTSSESPAWPNPISSRSISSGSQRNGGDYVVYRKALLSRYATKWLFALHCLDCLTYSRLLFDITCNRARESDYRRKYTDESENGATDSADNILRSLLKLYQASVTFSALDDLLLFWLDFVIVQPSIKVVPTLPRLFNREIDGSARWSILKNDVTIGSFDQFGQSSFDPWRIVIHAATQNNEGLKKSITWMKLFAGSGVDIPSSTFFRLHSSLKDRDGTFDDYAGLNHAIFLSIWLKSFGRQDLQELLSDLLQKQAPLLIGRGRPDHEPDEFSRSRFLRLLLSSCLLIYGSDRARLQELDLILNMDVDGLPPRRKVVKRASSVLEPVQLDTKFIETLHRLVTEGSQQQRLLVAKFMPTFLSDSSLLTTHEVENIILSNGHVLMRCAWSFYDIASPSIDDLRISFLLRLLVTDTLPLEELLQDYFDAQTHWRKRFQAATQLFRIILDVTKPSFQVEERQWRSAVLHVFVQFFRCAWDDQAEEVRVATDAWAQTLQPAHLQAIALCFDEALSRAPIADRLKLVSFLIILRTHFPTWRVLSWDVIIEALMDDDFIQRNGGGDDGAAAAHLSMYGITSQARDSIQPQDPNMISLQTALILLSMHMVADGVQIDLFSFLKIKYHLLVVLGSLGASLVPAPNGHSFHVQLGEMKLISEAALPCIPGIMALLDSYRQFSISPSAMIGIEDDTQSTLLVGSVVIDVFLSLFTRLENLQEIPFIYAKAMLQSLAIVIYKHDLESAPLKHLREQLRRVVRRVSEMLCTEISYELRLLILTVIRAYLKRWPAYASGILLHQVYAAIKVISMLEISTDDILVGQATMFLEDVFAQYASSGLFYQLCKRELDTECFNVLRLVISRNARHDPKDGSLRDAVLLDTIEHLIQGPHEPALKRVLENVKHYIDVVHHQGFTMETLAVIGRGLSVIVRNAGELSVDQFDPNPLMQSAATLMQHNKAQCRELFGMMDFILRPALLRFDVSSETAKKLLQVSTSLYKRTVEIANSEERGLQANLVSIAITDVLSDALRGRNRTTPSTLESLLEGLTTSGQNNDLLYLTRGQLSKLATDGCTYLQAPGGTEGSPQAELQACMAVASLILKAAKDDVGLLSRQLSENSNERTSRTSSLRTWNIIALDALQNFPVEIAAHIMTHLSTFSLAYHTALRMHVQLTGIPYDLSASEVNHAFIAIKLWLLLAQKCYNAGDQRDPFAQSEQTTERRAEDKNVSIVWNELWPPFERLVSLFESDMEEENSPEASLLANLIWSSIADIFLFLRQMRSSLSLESSSHIAILNRVKTLGKGEAFAGKFIRTVHSMTEPPPELPSDALLSQVAQEMLAAEKLRHLEVKKDIGRSMPERSRRDLRLQAST